MSEDERLPPETEEEAPTLTAGEKLANLAAEEQDLATRIEDLETELEDLKAKRTKLLRYTIPDALQEMGTVNTTVMDGNRQFTVKVSYKARGSLAYAEDIPGAVQYLEENGLPGGVLTVAEVDFTQSEMSDKARANLSAAAKALGKDVNWKMSINPQTLMSFVRKRKEEFPGFNEKKVGITLMREAKVTMKE